MMSSIENQELASIKEPMPSISNVEVVEEIQSTQKENLKRIHSQKESYKNSIAKFFKMTSPSSTEKASSTKTAVEREEPAKESFDASSESNDSHQIKKASGFSFFTLSRKQSPSPPATEENKPIETIVQGEKDIVEMKTDEADKESQESVTESIAPESDKEVIASAPIDNGESIESAPVQKQVYGFSHFIQTLGRSKKEKVESKTDESLVVDDKETSPKEEVAVPEIVITTVENESQVVPLASTDFIESEEFHTIHEPKEEVSTKKKSLFSSFFKKSKVSKGAETEKVNENDKFTEALVIETRDIAVETDKPHVQEAACQTVVTKKPLKSLWK